MKKNSKFRDVLIVGFALFAMFLGAANIIFPPYLGARSGSSWLEACLGFTLTGTGLPLLGILATATAGGNADDMPKRISPGFSRLFISLLVLFIGPLFCIPRTAATTVELSILPFLPEGANKFTVLFIGSLIFFGINLIFVLNPSNAIDKIGTFLTPVLVVFLLGMIILSIVNPVGQPVPPIPEVVEKGAFSQGFTTGYQTMDALAVMLFTTSVFSTLKAKGYGDEEARKMLIPVAIISGLGTAIVYGGFIWIGASGSAQLQSLTEFSSLTVNAVTLLAGNLGRIVLASIIFLACCTTSIGLLMTSSEYIYKVTGAKYKYRSIALLVTALSFVISIMGVDGIVQLAAPVLEVMYPAVIVLIALNLLGKRIKYDYAFHGGLLGAIPATILNVMRLYDPTKPIAERYLVFFPFGMAGFGAFVPAIIGALLGCLVGYILDRKHRLPSGRKLNVPGKPA